MNKMIKCQTCNEEIAAKAKVCPKCGAKIKKPFYMKWWVWVVAIVIISAIASGGSDNGEVKKTSSSSSDKAAEEVVEYIVGDSIETKKFEITVTNVKTTNRVGSQYFNEEPSEGGIFVVVEWECKNITDKPISSFSCPTIRVGDKNGTMYDADLNATTMYATETNLDRKILSDLNPGIKVKDAQVFEISEELYNNGEFTVEINADKDFSVKIK